MEQIVKVKNKKGVRVIPGFGLFMGVTIAMLSCLVLIPLASVFVCASELDFSLRRLYLDMLSVFRARLWRL